jgi:hypothetical protein
MSIQQRRGEATKGERRLVTEIQRLFTLPEVADRLHKSTRWMQYFLRDNPFGRMAGRTRLFTEDDVIAIIEALPAPSKSYGGMARQTPVRAEPSAASEWARAQKLFAEDKLKRSKRRLVRTRSWPVDDGKL